MKLEYIVNKKKKKSLAFDGVNCPTLSIIV